MINAKFLRNFEKWKKFNFIWIKEMNHFVTFVFYFEKIQNKIFIL